MIIKHVPEQYRELGIVLPDPGEAIGRVFPDFLIIGPWRTGTTWLSEMLRRHPDCFVTDPKETFYFSHLQGNQRIMVPREFSWYLDHFKQSVTGGRQPLWFGEASATYATQLKPEVIRFIYQINPAIKIIFGIRHPVERTMSHARMNFRFEPDTYDHLNESEKYGQAFSKKYIIEASLYTQHLAKWRSVIPFDQIYLFEFDVLQRDPVAAFAGVCRFLEAEHDVEKIIRIADEVGKVAGTRYRSVPGPALRKLKGMYRQEIKVLKQQYAVQFEKSDEQEPTPLVVVYKSEQGASETFITNHIIGLKAKTLRLNEYEPLDSAKRSGLRPLIRRWRAIKSNKRLHRDLQSGNRSILIEYGTNAVKALPALRGLQNRIVVHFHGYDAHQTSVVRANAAAYRELFSLADAIVVVSRKMEHALIDLGANPDKLHHIVCGVDVQQFHPTDVSQNPPVFFACGRFVEKKAPHLTIRAFHSAWLQDPSIRLRMAGEGAMLEMCQNLVKELKMTEVVHFLGAISHDQVAQELQNCRAFVQHSVVAANGDSEGTPVSVLEAGCSAVPVIATRHAGIADVVIDGKTGMLCDEGDIGTMAGAMSILAAHPDDAGRMGLAALKLVSGSYSMKQSIEKLSTLLKQP